MPHNMVNFGPLAAEIVSLVWGTPGNFNGFCVLAALLHGILVVGVSQTAALNRGRHLLAHISSYILFLILDCQCKGNQAHSKYKDSLTFCLALCCYSDETRTPIANLPNSAQIDGTPYHSPKLHPKLHPGPCSSVRMRRGTDRHTHTDMPMAMTTMHFVTRAGSVL